MFDLWYAVHNGGLAKNEDDAEPVVVVATYLSNTNVETEKQPYMVTVRRFQVLGFELSNLIGSSNTKFLILHSPSNDI